MQDFFEAIFGSYPESHHLCVWTLPKRESFWQPSNSEGLKLAASHAAQSAQWGDVYVSAAVAAGDQGAGRRIKNSTAAGISALWADVDYDHPAHEGGKKLPPDVDAARAMLDMALPEPSILVHSGHGLQAWWLFDKPWVFGEHSGDIDEDRSLAYELAFHWQGKLRDVMLRHEWTLDATHDLSRVLRVPGTVNHKREPVQVEIVAEKYNLRYDIEGLRRTSGAPRETRKRITTLPSAGAYRETEPIELREKDRREIDGERLEALLSVDPRARKSWEGDRPDLDDQSPSGLDLSLASFAVAAQWSDQEISDLIIARREKTGQDPGKCFRHKDYVARTILTARESAARDSIAEHLDDVVNRLEEARDKNAVGEVGSGTVEDARSGVLKAISETLGIEVIDVIKYVQDPPLYEFRLGGDVRVPAINSNILFNHNRMLQTFFDYADGHVIPSVKQDAWRRIVGRIGKVARIEETGDESTEVGSMVAYLHEYLAENTPEVQPDETTFIRRRPFVAEQRIAIFGTAFSSWLSTARSEKVGRRLATILRGMGAIPERHDVMIEGRRTSRSVWMLPPNEFMPPMRAVHRRAGKRLVS